MMDILAQVLWLMLCSVSAYAAGHARCELKHARRNNERAKKDARADTTAKAFKTIMNESRNDPENT